MILLDYNNKIIFETVSRALAHTEGKRDLLDITLADFDGVSFHISTPDPEARNIIRVSLQWSCSGDLLNHGGRTDLQQIYGPMLDAEPEPNYDVSVTFDANNPQEPEKLPLKMSFLKRHLLAAPFKKVMGAVFNKKGATEVVHIRYRSQTDEAVWIKPSSDSVTIVYSIRFADKSDKILAKVFLSELADARRSMTSVPAVRYSTSEPPMELQGQRDVPEGDDVGFVTLVLFEQHLQPKNMFKTINLAQNFRDYLHYHIKCSKAYMHTRMRERVSTWLQVLNRARPEPFEKKEKKLASGRTFKRK
jgi:actin related protein 2/3 complex, subunit 2